MIKPYYEQNGNLKVWEKENVKFKEDLKNCTRNVASKQRMIIFLQNKVHNNDFSIEYQTSSIVSERKFNE